MDGIRLAGRTGKRWPYFLIDVGMSPAIDYSQGALLLIKQEGKKHSREVWMQMEKLKRYGKDERRSGGLGNKAVMSQ